MSTAIKKTCECGDEFTVYPSTARQKHCSRKCSSTFIARKPKTGFRTLCEVCGTEFYRPKVLRPGAGRFCSVPCRKIGQTKEPVVKICARLGCGKELRLKPSRGVQLYCNNRCKGDALTKRPMDRLHNGRATRYDQYGYVMVFEPEHPRAMHDWYYEHRLVVEAVIGRYLTSDEVVDHINQIKDDNRPENLQVLTPSTHSVKTNIDMRANLDKLRSDAAEVAEYRRRFGPLT